jgi:hypothetical protein
MGTPVKRVRFQSPNQRYLSWFGTMKVAKQGPQATAALRMKKVLKTS